jgi:hypothetical protein
MNVMPEIEKLFENQSVIKVIILVTVRFPILCSDYENQATMLIVLDLIVFQNLFGHVNNNLPYSGCHANMT